MKLPRIFHRLLTFALSLRNFAGWFRKTLAFEPTRQHYDFHTSPDGVFITSKSSTNNYDMESGHRADQRNPELSGTARYHGQDV